MYETFQTKYCVHTIQDRQLTGIYLCKNIYLLITNLELILKLLFAGGARKTEN